MRYRFLMLLLLLAASQANASALYKCEGPKSGEISIQSDPCPAGSKQIWKRDGTPEPEPSSEQLQARELQRQKNAEAARTLSRMAGTDGGGNRSAARGSKSKVNPAAKRCTTAKQQAKVIRDRDWKKLTVERLRQLDTWVDAECQDTN